MANYIVINDVRYDIILPDEHACDSYITCKTCPLDGKGCTNIIDFINIALDVSCEDDVVVIKHEE